MSPQLMQEVKLT